MALKSCRETSGQRRQSGVTHFPSLRACARCCGFGEASLQFSRERNGRAQFEAFKAAGGRPVGPGKAGWLIGLIRHKRQQRAQPPADAQPKGSAAAASAAQRSAAPLRDAQSPNDNEAASGAKDLEHGHCSAAAASAAAGEPQGSMLSAVRRSVPHEDSGQSYDAASRQHRKRRVRQRAAAQRRAAAAAPQRPRKRRRTPVYVDIEAGASSCSDDEEEDVEEEGEFDDFIDDGPVVQ